MAILSICLHGSRRMAWLYPMRILRSLRPDSLVILVSAANAATICGSFRTPHRMMCGYCCLDGNTFFFLLLFFFFPASLLASRRSPFAENVHGASVRTWDASPDSFHKQIKLLTHHCDSSECNTRCRLLTILVGALWLLASALINCATLQKTPSVYLPQGLKIY